jgi:hypothetical protein
MSLRNLRARDHRFLLYLVRPRTPLAISDLVWFFLPYKARLRLDIPEAFPQRFIAICVLFSNFWMLGDKDGRWG